MFCLFGMASIAQVPGFREKGYKGSVSYNNMVLAWNGVSTSHGYMFNSHHYLGAGAGVFGLLAFDEDGVAVADIFLDYKAYWFDRPSTPVAGVKLCYLRSLGSDYSDPLKMLGLEPSIGWSWGLKSGKGLSLQLGCRIAGSVDYKDSRLLECLPTLTFSFDF